MGTIKFHFIHTVPIGSISFSLWYEIAFGSFKKEQIEYFLFQITSILADKQIFETLIVEFNNLQKITAIWEPS